MVHDDTGNNICAYHNPLEGTEKMAGTEAYIKWYKKKDGDYTLGLYCRACNMWMAWLPMTMPWIALAPERPADYAPH